MKVARQALMVARIEAGQGTPEEKARVMAWDRLYGMLSTLDSKVSVLLRFNAIVVAALAYVVVVRASDPFVTANATVKVLGLIVGHVSLLASVLSCGFAFPVINVEWEFFGGRLDRMADGEPDFDDAALQRARRSRGTPHAALFAGLAVRRGRRNGLCNPGRTCHNPLIMSDIILHHYAVSPYAEKVRIGLGLKQAAWQSVDIPNVMPKPDLMPLTGGYRKTPVMQIGADIYCDTQLIMLELDRRLPAPPFLPKGREGEARAITMWIDRNIFSPAVGVVMSQVADRFGEAFKKDRSEFSGRSFDAAKLKRRRAADACATRPTPSCRLGRDRCWPMAASSCWAGRLAWPTARSTIRCGSSSSSSVPRPRRSTGCPGSSPGRSA